MVSSGAGPVSNVEREVKLDAGLRFSLPELGGVLTGVTAVALPDAKLQALKRTPATNSPERPVEVSGTRAPLQVMA